MRRVILSVDTTLDGFMGGPAGELDWMVQDDEVDNQAFVKLGLIDEYRMKVHPVAIGDGLPVFTDLEGKLNLTLVRSKAYGSGVLGLYYAPDHRP
jgi:dihydrofolate reductase